MFGLFFSALITYFSAVSGDVDRCITSQMNNSDGGYCQLHGKVKIVNSHAKYRVKIVNSFPDLYVKIVNDIADDAGEWKIVKTNQDITVEVVQSGEDLRIQFVNNFPGCR